MEFRNLKAEEYCDSVRDGTHDSPKHTEIGFKLITSKHIKENYIDFESAYCISEEDYIKVNQRSLVEINDILYSMIGTIGLIYRVRETPNFAIKNMGLFKIKDELKSKWLYYYLKTPYMVNYINKMLTGSTQQYVTLKILRELPIKFPIQEQNMRKIVKVLESVENKIELNNYINDNLLNILRSYFKKCCIDNVKENWKEKKLEDIVSIRRGASPRPIQDFLSTEGINWLKISDVTETDSPFIYDIKEKIIEEGKTKSVFIAKGTLVVSNSATPGIPKFIMVDTCVHDGWLVFSDYEKKYKNYLYFLIEQIRDSLIKLANGSVFNNLKTDILKQYRFYNPDDETLSKFNRIAEPMMKMINNNTYENINLEIIRDTLLPKLMNGDIDLDKIEI